MHGEHHQKHQNRYNNDAFQIRTDSSVWFVRWFMFWAMLQFAGLKWKQRRFFFCLHKCSSSNKNKLIENRTLSYNCFFSVNCSSASLLCNFSGRLSSFKNTSSKPENATPLKMQTTGVNVSIRRTITPAKYTALIAYKMTKTRSSLIRLIVYHNPTGNVHTKMCKSKKNENQVVGWCSETDAIIGIWILA